MDLRELYIESANNLIKSIEGSISLIKKDLKNPELRKILSRQAHTLRGNSMQAGEYFIGYLASKIEALGNTTEPALSEIDLMFISDIFDSLVKTFNTLYTKSKNKLNVELLNQLNEFSRIEYENLEKEMLKDK